MVSNRDDPRKFLMQVLGGDADKVIDDLLNYKGAITKAGQILSLYGEYFLPKAINEKLKLIQAETNYLELSQIIGQVPSNVVESFTIVEKPIAAASIGQVHRATNNGPQTFVLKIQYKGIKKAIKADLFFIKLLFKTAKFIPKGIDLNGVFDEIHRILLLEMDYNREGRLLEMYADVINDDYFVIPKYYKKYSNESTLCLDLYDGIKLSEVVGLKSQELGIQTKEKSKIGEKIFELFLRELFEFNIIQTDAHGGNFLVSHDLSEVCLIDFGACIEYEEGELDFYKKFLFYGHKEDKDGFLNVMDEFFLTVNDSFSYDRDLFWEYVLIVTTPLRSRDYSWGESKIPDELFEKLSELQKSIKVDRIPSKFVFIDRKVIGLFSLLKSLDARFNVESLFTSFSTKY